jgi:hypothetical protein
MLGSSEEPLEPIQARSLKAASIQGGYSRSERGWVACSWNSAKYFGHEARQLKVDIPPSRHSQNVLHYDAYTSRMTGWGRLVQVFSRPARLAENTASHRTSQTSHLAVHVRHTCAEEMSKYSYLLRREMREAQKQHRAGILFRVGARTVSWACLWRFGACNHAAATRMKRRGWVGVLRPCGSPNAKYTHILAQNDSPSYHAY